MGLLGSIGVLLVKMAAEIALQGARDGGGGLALADAAAPLAPTLAFGLALALLQRRSRHPLRSLVPAFAGALALFYGALALRCPLDSAPAAGARAAVVRRARRGRARGRLALPARAARARALGALVERARPRAAACGARARALALARAGGAPTLTMAALVLLKGQLIFPAYEKAFGAALDTPAELVWLGLANVAASACGRARRGAAALDVAHDERDGRGPPARGRAHGRALRARRGGAAPGGSLRVVGYAPIFVVAGLLLAQGLALLRQFVLEPLPRVAAAEASSSSRSCAPSPRRAWRGAWRSAAPRRSRSLFTSKVADAGCIRYEGSALLLRSRVSRERAAVAFLDLHGDRIRSRSSRATSLRQRRADLRVGDRHDLEILLAAPPDGGARAPPARATRKIRRRRRRRRRRRSRRAPPAPPSPAPPPRARDVAARALRAAAAEPAGAAARGRGRESAPRVPCARLLARLRRRRVRRRRVARCDLRELARAARASLCISGASAPVRDTLERGGLVDGGERESAFSRGGGVAYFANLDEALGATEDLLLEDRRARRRGAREPRRRPSPTPRRGSARTARRTSRRRARPPSAHVTPPRARARARRARRGARATSPSNAAARAGRDGDLDAGEDGGGFLKVLELLGALSRSPTTRASSRRSPRACTRRRSRRARRSSPRSRARRCRVAAARAAAGRARGAHDSRASRRRRRRARAPSSGLVFIESGFSSSHARAEPDDAQPARGRRARARDGGGGGAARAAAAASSSRLGPARAARRWPGPPLGAARGRPHLRGDALPRARAAVRGRARARARATVAAIAAGCAGFVARSRSLFARRSEHLGAPDGHRVLAPHAAVGALGDGSGPISPPQVHAARREPPRGRCRARKAAHRLGAWRAVAPPPAAPAAAPLAASAPLDGDGLGATALQERFDPT